MKYRVNRSDAGSHALIKEAKGYGARYLPINGVIDGVLWFRGQVYLVDWKGAKTPLTARQERLRDEGWPLWFIRDSPSLRAVLFGEVA